MKRLFFLIIIAITLLSSCTVLYRAVRYGSEDIDDHKIFPTYNFAENREKFHFVEASNELFDTLDVRWKYKDIEYHNLDSLLGNTSTRSFLVIRNDTILYERYFRGYKRDDISTVFSVSKSVTSLLVGIAIDEGFINDVKDPVVKYISELNTADPMFQKLTIEHLLDMRSGIDFDEDYSFNPFSEIARLYYGRNQLAQKKR